MMGDEEYFGMLLGYIRDKGMYYVRSFWIRNGFGDYCKDKGYELEYRFRSMRGYYVSVSKV